MVLAACCREDCDASHHPDRHSCSERCRPPSRCPLARSVRCRCWVYADCNHVEPEAVVHQMTALKTVSNPRKFDQEFRVTNELRTRGTDYLLEAAHAVGARRFVAQSYPSWRDGGPPQVEDHTAASSPSAFSVRSTSFFAPNLTKMASAFPKRSRACSGSPFWLDMSPYSYSARASA